MSTITISAKETRKDSFRILIAFLIPPAGVAMQLGFGFQFWLNVLLTLCGLIPGILHAVYIILTRAPDVKRIPSRSSSR
jgi:uncharacterized membrane protein YqaE (UPF0057 family)